MSLVHKVLQDIDQRHDDAPSLPPGLQATVRQRPLKPALAIAVLLMLVAALVAWRLLLVPATEAVSSPELAARVPSATHVADRAAASEPLEATPVASEPVTETTVKQNASVAPDPVAVNVPAAPVSVTRPVAVNVPAAPVTRPMAVNDDESAGSNASDAEAVRETIHSVARDAKAAVPVSAPNNVPNSARNNARNNASTPAASEAEPAEVAPTAVASVTRRDDGERQRFASALQQMQSGQWLAAQQQLQPLLESQDASALERYRTAYLRTLVEQQQWPDMLQFYRRHQTMTTVSWLAVAAPGLHMAGEYQLAAPAYQQLMRQQPQQVSWPLALLWLYRQMQQPEAARQLLPKLARHSNLNPQQRRWLQQQAQELTSP